MLINYHFLAAIAYFFVISGILINDDILTKKLIIVACIFNAFYFHFLGLHISSAMIILTGIRILTSIHTKHFLAGLFFISLAIATPFYLESVDYISALTGITGTVAVFWLKGIWMRTLIILTSFIWVVNNYFYGAHVAFFGELLVFSMGILKILHHNLSKNIKSDIID